VRHIGVSNFNRALMAEAVRLSAPIVINQCEYHPYLNHALLIDECRRLDISVIAYCGEAVGRVFTDPVLKEMVRTRGRSVAQVVLRWLGAARGCRRPVAHDQSDACRQQSARVRHRTDCGGDGHDS
jgi:2,5-diketo-D-gluconate reductase B